MASKSFQLALPSNSNGNTQDSNSPTLNFLNNNNNDNNNLIVGFGRKNLNPDALLEIQNIYIYIYQLLSQVFCEYINHLKSYSRVKGLVR